MALSRVQGHMLLANLERDANLHLYSTVNNGNLINFDIVNMRVGLNTSNPGNLLDVNGNSTLTNLSVPNIAYVTNLQILQIANLSSNANVKISGGTPGYALVTDGSGNLSWGVITGNGNVSIGAANQLAMYTASNNIVSNSGPNLTWVTNTTLTVTGNASSSTSTGAIVVVGGLGVSGNINANNIIATNFANVVSMTATGNVNANNISLTNFVNAVSETITANSNANNYVATSTVKTPNVYNSGAVVISTTSTGNISISPTAGSNVQVTANTNITSTTTSTSSTTGALVVAGGAGIAGNLYVGAISNLGSNANVKISGGSSGNVLLTDGSGNLSWGTAGGTPGGANIQVQYNDAGVFGGNANFTFDKANIQLTINSMVQSFVVGNTQTITIAANNQVLMGGQYEIVGTVDCTGEIHVL